MSLVGIARMAAESPLLEEKRRVSYLELPARSFIGACSGRRMPFDWTVNPYRGCEYGCKYCYARYTHEFMELPVGEFETRIFAKQWDAAIFRADIRKLKPNQSVAFGTATDCYQPAERRYGLMRRMLEIMARETQCLRVGITTKSDLVARDADLLAEIARRNVVRVHFTITTVDTDLARKLEPFAPRPTLRLEAMGELSRAGVRTGLSASPVLPGLTDSETSLSAVAEASATMGATTMHARPLFLKECAQAVFFPWLETEFPALVSKYRAFFQQNAYMRGAYPDLLKERVDRVRRKYRLVSDREFHAPDWAEVPQMRLFV